MTRSKIASEKLKFKSISIKPVASVIISRAGNSFCKTVAGTRSGLIKEQTPNTTPMLNRLEPNEFPIANSGLFSRAATADEKISGADVPKATTVRPIIKGDTPKFCAKLDAPSTNLSAPQINPTNPSIIIVVAMSIDFRNTQYQRSSQLEGSLILFASNNLLPYPIHVDLKSIFVVTSGVFQFPYIQWQWVFNFQGTLEKEFFLFDSRLIRI